MNKRVRDLKVLDTIGPILSSDKWRIVSIEIVDGNHKLGIVCMENIRGSDGARQWITLNPNIELEATEYCL
jgi:hypothetical protein